MPKRWRNVRRILGWFRSKWHDRKKGRTSSMEKTATLKENIDDKSSMHPSILRCSKTILSPASKKNPHQKDASLKKTNKSVKWNECVEVENTFAGGNEEGEYDRTSEAAWLRLTQRDKIKIKEELNEYKKNEMKVHKKSKSNTRYHK